MSRIKRMTLLLAGLAGAIAFGPAFAQSTIEEIRVTAERREADIQDVPLAVSAFSRDQLEKLQVTEGRDLQRYVPSLNMFNNITHPSNLSLSMRGGLQQDASLVVAESPIGIYIDDVYVGRLNGNNVRLSDIERVEVLRGPQGTLYGRNTGYGAIKYISRTPGEDSWFDATLGAGNEDQLVARASVGGPLGGDGFAGSLAAQWTEKDGEFQNVWENNDDRGSEENAAVRGKLRYTGIDRLDAVLMVAYAKAENDSLQLVKGITPNVPSNQQFTTDDLVFPNGEWKVNTPYQQLGPAPLRDRPQAETEQTLVGLTLSYDINEGLTLKSITGYVGTEDFFHTDFSGNSAAAFPFPPFNLPAPAYFGATGASDVESDQFTQELQLLGTIGNRFKYILGAFYLNEDADQNFGWHFVAPLSRSLIEVETDSYAVFGQADYQVTDRLKVTAGLRWTKDEKDFAFNFQGAAGNIFGVPTEVEVVNRSDDFDETTPKLGLDYNFGNALGADSLLLYAQAAKGYKGGGYSAIALASLDPVGVYDPEINWTYEGGLKADWFGSRLRTNIVYFFSDIEDIQQNSTVESTGPIPEFPVENVADAEIQGLEFEISAVPIDGLNLFLSGALLDGEYKNVDPNGSAGQALANYGVDPQTPQTPDYQINVGFDYTFDFPGDLIGDVSFGADYYEIDDYVTAATNDFYNSGWDIWNAFVSAQIADNWEAKVTGKNLADDFIITSGSRGLGGFIGLYPREILFTLTYRYGQ